MVVFDYRGWNCHMIRRLGGFTIDMVSIAEVSKLCGMKASYTISEFKTMYSLISYLIEIFIRLIKYLTFIN